MQSCLSDKGASTSSSGEVKCPPKKRPLADTRALAFQMEQDHKFERLMSALELQQQQMQQHVDVDPDVDAFVSGIAFLLQKSTGQTREEVDC